MPPKKKSTKIEKPEKEKKENSKLPNKKIEQENKKEK